MTTSDGPDHFDVVTFHGGAAHAAPISLAILSGTIRVYILSRRAPVSVTRSDEPNRHRGHDMPSLEPDLEDVPNRVSLHTDPGPGYAKRYRTLLEGSGGRSARPPKRRASSQRASTPMLIGE